MNTIKSSTILVSLLITGLQISNAKAMSDADLFQNMRKQTSKYIVNLKKPRMFFHWVDASDITPKGQYEEAFEATDSIFAKYVSKQGSKILNQRSDSDHDIAGPGLYLASDPLISRSYGGKNRYGLIVGITKANAKFFVQSFNATFSSDIAKEIESRGCNSGDSVIELLDSTNPNCTKIKQLLIGKDLSFADARIYNWATFSKSLPGCTVGDSNNELIPQSNVTKDNQKLDTIVAFSTNLFSEIYGFTHKSKLSTKSENARKILSYLKGLQGYKNQMGKFQNINFVSAAQLQDSSIVPMSNSEMAEFTSKNILGCL
jgi:hypothetical protein